MLVENMNDAHINGQRYQGISMELTPAVDQFQGWYFDAWGLTLEDVHWNASIRTVPVAAVSPLSVTDQPPAVDDGQWLILVSKKLYI